MLRGRLFVLVLALTMACESSPCGPPTCTSGCCSGGRCFEGTNVKGGLDCDAFDAGSCALIDQQCDSKRPCCATDPQTTFPLRCSGAFCEEACGRYNDPCNASLCCARGYVCKGERCDSCYGKGTDCSYDFQRTRCCPGFACRLKAGFTTVYECQ